MAASKISKNIPSEQRFSREIFSRDRILTENDTIRENINTKKKKSILRGCSGRLTCASPSERAIFINNFFSL